MNPSREKAAIPKPGAIPGRKTDVASGSSPAVGKTTGVSKPGATGRLAATTKTTTQKTGLKPAPIGRMGTTATSQSGTDATKPTNTPPTKRQQDAAKKIQGLVRGHLVRQERNRPVLLTNPDDATFGRQAKDLAKDNKFDVRTSTGQRVLPDGSLSKSTGRQIPPKTTAVLFHGRVTADAVTSKGIEKGTTRTELLGNPVVPEGAKKVAKDAVPLARQMGKSNLLPKGTEARLSSLGCWSGADKTSRPREVKDNPYAETSFGQDLADAAGMRVTAANGPLQVVSKEGGKSSFQVTLNRNDTGGVTHSSAATLASLTKGQLDSGARLATEKPGGDSQSWREFSPRTAEQKASAAPRRNIQPKISGTTTTAKATTKTTATTGAGRKVAAPGSGTSASTRLATTTRAIAQKPSPSTPGKSSAAKPVLSGAGTRTGTVASVVSRKPTVSTAGSGSKALSAPTTSGSTIRAKTASTSVSQRPTGLQPLKSTVGSTPVRKTTTIKPFR